MLGTTKYITKVKVIWLFLLFKVPIRELEMTCAVYINGLFCFLLRLDGMDLDSSLWLDI